MPYQLKKLSRKTGVELVHAIKTLTDEVVDLDLGNNGLGNKSGTELAQALIELPKNLTALDLDSNSLYMKTGVS